MPQGYAWIFPMGQSTLKVGVIRYFLHENHVPHKSSFQYYLDQLINEHLRPKTQRIFDKHGKTIYFTSRQQDKRIEGNVIAIGDAISCVNPLGGEGIRHALVSAKLAAKTIHGYLSGTLNNLNLYESEMGKYLGYKWRISEWMMHYLYKMDDDKRMDTTVKSFRMMDCEQLMRVVFGYQFQYTIKSFLMYFVYRFCSIFKIPNRFRRKE
jgi:flavin-dependent dehydrogenase